MNTLPCNAFRYAFIAAVLATVAGCGPKVEEQARWGIYQEPVAANPVPQASGEGGIDLLWRKDLSSGEISGFAQLTPASRFGNIYAASREGGVFKYAGVDGKAAWQITLDSPINIGVAVGDDDLLVVAHDNGVVSGIDDKDGNVRWTSAIKRPVSALPAIGNGRVIVRTSDGLVIGLNANTGEVVWQVKKEVPALSLQGDATPVIVGDAVLVGLSSGRLFAYNVINGRDYWEAEIGQSGGQDEIERLKDADTPPVVRGSTIFAATYQGSVQALQLQDAATLWRTELSTRLPMAADEENLFVTQELGELAAIRQSSGEIQWRQDALTGRGVSYPVFVNDVIIVGDNSGRLHILSPDDGSLLYSEEVVSGAIIGLSVAGNAVSVYSSRGELALLAVARQSG